MENFVAQLKSAICLIAFAVTVRFNDLAKHGLCNTKAFLGIIWDPPG